MINILIPEAPSIGKIMMGDNRQGNAQKRYHPPMVQVLVYPTKNPVVSIGKRQVKCNADPIVEAETLVVVQAHKSGIGRKPVAGPGARRQNLWGKNGGIIRSKI
jgi:hypothetical protein